MKGTFEILANGMLIPANDETREFIRKKKLGTGISGEFKQIRNYNFLRKYMALMNIGYDAFEPEIAEYKGQVVEKNFDRFRHDITIMAGYYTFTTDINGEVKAVAKSISFGSMEEEEFSVLYSKTIDVLLRKVLTEYTKDNLENVVDQVIGFT